ncbi:MAG TPA: DUF1801 domain-containing protein [Bryobacteraceae bacterium]|nr:DUF1801 domain-containing protein [Bryobacteraceae bacterium]
MAAPKFASVDAYIAAQPEESRATLLAVRAAIQAALPEADEVISYNIPGYKVAYRPVLYFAGWKRHFSLYPATAAMAKAFAEELQPYAIEKSTLKIPLQGPAPAELIGRLAKFRAAEEAAKLPSSH